MGMGGAKIAAHSPLWPHELYLDQNAEHSHWHRLSYFQRMNARMKSAKVIPPQMVQRSHRAMAKASLGVRARMYFWNTFRAGSRGSPSRSFLIMSARISYLADPRTEWGASGVSGESDMAKAKTARKTNRKTCSTAGRGLKKNRSSSAGRHLGGPCKKRAAKKKK
eukprot:scaffold7729_cov120-Isochrysis_galbana.AAC.9